MAIGRLDATSEGLLFLTTHGAVSQLIRSNKFEKEYYAQVDGEITDEAIEQLQNGIEISVNKEKYITQPCVAGKIEAPSHLQLNPFKIRGDHHGPTSWVSITLREGKFRQVRKMTAATGFATLRLIRYRIGNEVLTGMENGEVKEVELFDL